MEHCRRCPSRRCRVENDQRVLALPVLLEVRDDFTDGFVHARDCSIVARKIVGDAFGEVRRGVFLRHLHSLVRRTVRGLAFFAAATGSVSLPNDDAPCGALNGR